MPTYEPRRLYYEHDVNGVTPCGFGNAPDFVSLADGTLTPLAYTGSDGRRVDAACLQVEAAVPFTRGTFLRADFPGKVMPFEGGEYAGGWMQALADAPAAGAIVWASFSRVRPPQFLQGFSGALAPVPAWTLYVSDPVTGMRACGAGERPHGVITHHQGYGIAIGDGGSVIRVRAGGTFAVGDLLVSDANGHVVKHISGQPHLRAESAPVGLEPVVTARFLPPLPPYGSEAWNRLPSIDRY